MSLLADIEALTEALEVGAVVKSAARLASILEKKRSNKAGSYYYEEIELKRWLLGPGGVSGNCDDCVENAEAGWIEASEFFPADGSDGPVDEPPLHPNCLCDVEYRDTRRRVYV